MGRQLIRAKNKVEQMDAKKDKILVTRKQLGRWKDKIYQETSEYNVEALMTCFALANVNVFHHDEEQVMTMLQYIDSLMDAVVKGDVSIADYVKDLETKGVKIQCKN